MPSALMKRLAKAQAAVQRDSGVSIRTEDPVPKWFRDLLDKHFKHDLGAGNMVIDWPDKKTKKLIRYFEVFVSFGFSTSQPCTELTIKQWFKVFRFQQRAPGDGFRWYIDPGDPEGETSDPPPVIPDNAVQDPGEVKPNGSGGFGFYDIPGLPVMTKRKIAAERVRWLFKTQIFCDGAVIRTFYWALEITIPYDGEGTPLPKKGSSAMAQITKDDYLDEEGRFRKNHAP